MLISAILTTVRILPPELAVILVRLILLIYLTVRADYRREINTNYRVIFGKDRRWFWVRNAWRVGRNLALMAKIGTNFAQELVDRVLVSGENINIKSRSREQELHMLMASFHFGVWEYLPQIFARRSGSVAVVVSEQRNPVLDFWLKRLRTGHGVKLIFQISQLFRRLSSPGITGFMLDNTSRGHALWIQLAGPDDSSRLMFRIPALPFQVLTRTANERKVAVRGVVPVFGYLRKGRLVVRMFPAGDEENAIRALFTMIREMPEEWIFWGKAGAVQKLVEAE